MRVRQWSVFHCRYFMMKSFSHSLCSSERFRFASYSSIFQNLSSWSCKTVCIIRLQTVDCILSFCLFWIPKLPPTIQPSFVLWSIRWLRCPTYTRFQNILAPNNISTGPLMLKNRSANVMPLGIWKFWVSTATVSNGGVIWSIIRNDNLTLNSFTHDFIVAKISALRLIRIYPGNDRITNVLTIVIVYAILSWACLIESHCTRLLCTHALNRTYHK